MHIDYSKSKSYQRIVAKAKRYSPKGEDSLRANRERMQKKRSIFKTMMAADIIKDTREGGKELKKLQENSPEEITKKFRTYNPEQQKVIRDVAKATIKFPKSLLIDSVLKASGDGKAYTPPPISKIRDDQRGLYDIAKDTYNRVNNLRKQYGVSANLLTGEITKKGQLKGFNYRVDTDLFGRDKKVNVSFQKDF